jgi:AcrR family transcriptional regulator
MTRKEQIIEKAIELFAAESFESISIQRLAEETGVAQGLLYRHFKGKNDLLLHLLGMGIEQVRETLQPYADDSLDFEEAFAQHIKSAFKYMRSHYTLWKVLHNTRQNAALMKSLQLSADPETEIIKPIKEKLQKEKVNDAEIKAWYIFSLVDGVTSLYLAHPDIYPLKKMRKFLSNKIEEYVD